MTEILILDGHVLTRNDDGSMHRSSVAELAAEIQRLRTPKSPPAPAIADRDETIDRVCRGVASNQEGATLRAYIAALEQQNAAFQNLVDNLEPGPISQALAENQHKQALSEPAAWRAEDGRLISHELKTTLTPRSATQAFTEPLYPSRHGGRMLLWAVGQLLDELPKRRDWLNPDVEKVLRAETGKPAK